EKGGITKKETPLLLGPVSDSVETIIEELAVEKRSPIYRYGKEYSCKVIGKEGDHLAGELTWLTNEKFKFIPALKGEHQIYNAAQAGAACKLMGKNNAAISSGIANAFWPGRLEILDIRGIEVILDCAHNPGGIQSLTKYLKSTGRSNGVVGFGAANAKNGHEMVRAL